jgi:hypothetical protein
MDGSISDVLGVDETIWRPDNKRYRFASSSQMNMSTSMIFCSAVNRRPARTTMEYALNRLRNKNPDINSADDDTLNVSPSWNHYAPMPTCPLKKIVFHDAINHLP